MTQLILTTVIKAPAEICFDLSLSADIHLQSTSHAGEKVVAGRTSGIFEEGEEVTWQAKHFGFTQRLTTKITSVNRPHFFEDRMLKGAFKSMHHVHAFEYKDDVTYMKDVFSYEVPLGFIGRLFDWLALKKHMRQLLETRNGFIKKEAERISSGIK